MNPFDSSLFTAPSCLPCCTPAPADCSCALLIPPANDFVTSPYADYSTAETAIADQVASCIGYVRKTDGLLTSFTADPSVADQLTLVAVGNPDDAPSCQAVMWASLSMKAGSTMSVAASVGGTLADANTNLYSCDGTLLDTQTGASQTFSISSDGEYLVECSVTSTTGGFGGGSDTMTAVISSDDTLWVNPVIALWDDSGTTRQLWACPKLLLPPLTESTGDWYVDATAAATAISTLTNGCKGYIESTTNVSSFSASGTTSLTLAETLTAGAMSCPTVWGGINAVDAATITSTITVGAGTAGQTVTIYDDTGTQVETSGATTSPWTSAALPYTGRYTVKIAMTSSGNTTSMSAAITSSGTMSVNTVQARYDLGLVCAATDDC